jgi:outer membrane protein insertion porin family
LRRPLAVLALVLLGLAGCGRAENGLLLLEKLPDVASITIKGNHAFDDGTLKGLMTTKAGHWWNPFEEHKFRKGQLESDIQAILTFYMRHGYLRARLVDQSVRHDGDKVHITLTFEEGEPVTVDEVVIRGARALNPNDLRKKLALEPDHPMDPFKLEDDRRLILRTLADKGYWEAAVDADVQFFGNRALVFYVLDEGNPVTVSRITVRGNQQVPTRLAYREISVREGRLLKLEDLVKSQTRLLQSSYFADAQWDTAGLDTTDNTVKVDFRVRERRLHWVESGIGVTSQEQVRFTGEWGSRSFVGTGMRFAVTSRTEFDFTGRLPTVLSNHRTDVILNQPHLLGTQWEGQPSVYYLFDREHVVLPAVDYDYYQQVVDLGVSARRLIGNLRSQIVLSLENRWVYNHADSVARYSDPQLFRDFYQTRLLTGRVERDNRNDFFNPSHGGYQNLTLESAGGALGGNNAFQKGTGSVIKYTPAPVDRWVLAGRFQLGYIHPSSNASTVAGRPITSRVELVPSEDRYRLGGSNTVRGYQLDALTGVSGPDQPAGGLVELLGNVEVRIPLFWRLSTVTFLDAGNVWQDREELKWSRFVPHENSANVNPFDVRYSYGVGLRLSTPVGPIRLDYARKWNSPLTVAEGKERWHVALGQAF